jgi:hypothetical protein
MPVKGTFQDMNIPANASLANGGRIGTPSNGLFIDRYFGEKDGGTITHSYIRYYVTLYITLH